jgi:hypothetical protein
MVGQDNFDEEALTPEERLNALLARIAQDMELGRLSSACATLRRIGQNPLQLMLIEKLSELKEKYDSLSLNCHNYDYEK